MKRSLWARYFQKQIDLRQAARRKTMKRFLMVMWVKNIIDSINSVIHSLKLSLADVHNMRHLFFG